MFSQACVMNSVHGGGVQTPPWADTHTLDKHPLGRPPPPHEMATKWAVPILLECVLLILTITVKEAI